MIGLAIFIIGMIFGGAGVLCAAALLIEDANSRIHGDRE